MLSALDHGTTDAYRLSDYREERGASHAMESRVL